MNVVAHADPAAVSAGWKWIAVLIGLGVLAILALIATIAAKGGLWQLVEGADGQASTSKFQWLLWLAVIVFAYTALWVLRAKQGDYAAIIPVPVNLLTVLGLSTGTAAAAKGITTGYVQSNRLAKPMPDENAAGGLIQSDSGVLDLAKLQIIAFTMIAIGIFLATLIHQIVSSPPIVTLPNIDSSLLVLMGISEAGYLGNKLVTINWPVLYPPNPSVATVGQRVTVTGANLGAPSPDSAPPAGAQLTLDGVPVDNPEWSSSAIVFIVPGPPPASPRQAQLLVFVAGRSSNAVTLTISPSHPARSNGGGNSPATATETSG